MYRNFALTIVAIAIIATSCQNKQQSNSQESTPKENIMTESKASPLGDALKARSLESAQKFSDEKKKIYADGIEAVANSGVLQNALKVGDTALDFTLTNASGKAVTLYDELKNGPVILTWYRGGWCPYCNISLHFLQERLPDFKAAGASLFALTPELPDKSLSTAEKHSLDFEVLSDVGNAVGRNYGLIFKLTDGVAEMYNNAFDLNTYNGDESNELPLAATYVIDTDGTIKFAFLDADYRNRAEPDDIIEAVNKLTKK
jgi:peroxiredoxin